MSDPAPARRFVPTPVETSVKSNRKFAVEPVETSARSSKVTKPAESSPPLKKPRFAPEPIETSVRSNRADAATSEPTSSSDTSSQISSASSVPADSPLPKPTRRFAPQLIETVKRIKRAGDSVPATLPTDKTDITPGTKHIYLPKKKPGTRPLVYPMPPDNTPNASISSVPRLIPRREQSMRPHLNTRRSTRQDSFHSELEPIASDEDAEHAEEEEEHEGTPSLSGSFRDSSEDSLRRLRLARTRESCDDRFSGYLLALAAKAAEKQLREQALAAFPNESVHEVVEHFYDREIEGGSEDEGIITAMGLLPQDDDDEISVMHIERRPTEVGWAFKEMQQHQENLQKMREEEEKKKLAEETKQPAFHDPFWTNGMTNKIAAAVKGAGGQDQQKKFELEKMRKAASPPMLGGDLKFRVCPSPKATKLETDQLHYSLPNRCENGGGLWGGYCVANETQQYLSPVPRGPTMIQTPTVERDDPFGSAFANELPASERVSPTSPTFHIPIRSTGTPPSPTSSRKTPGKGIHLVAGINSRLQAHVKQSKLEEEIAREFDDQFVTQVYNYLSLGYPALAWAYDAELSKISKVSMEDLRQNDRSKDIKGYIGAPESAGSKGHCARWMALKVYVREWARQHPSMAEGGGAMMWGVRARRGSWAI